MSDPTPYTPGYDFTASDKGPELNVQLADIAQATVQLVDAVKDIRRSDGALQNEIVTAESLHPSALAALGEDGVLVAGAVAQAQAAAEVATEAQNAAENQALASISAANAAAASANAAAASANAALASADAAAGSASSALASANAAAAAAAAPIAFMAHRNNADQTGILPDTATKVVANSEVFDQGGAYDSANARWTPAAGRYRLVAAALFTAGVVDQQQFRAMIYKNGALFRQVVVVASGTAAISATVSCTDAANGTDFYEFFVQGAGAGNKTVSGAAANTWFEGSAL